MWISMRFNTGKIRKNAMIFGINREFGFDLYKYIRINRDPPVHICTWDGTRLSFVDQYLKPKNVFISRSFLERNVHFCKVSLPAGNRKRGDSNHPKMSLLNKSSFQHKNEAQDFLSVSQMYCHSIYVINTSAVVPIVWHQGHAPLSNLVVNYTLHCSAQRRDLWLGMSGLFLCSRPRVSVVS